MFSLKNPDNNGYFAMTSYGCKDACVKSLFIPGVYMDHFENHFFLSFSFFFFNLSLPFYGIFKFHFEVTLKISTRKHYLFLGLFIYLFIYLIA